MTQWSDIFLVSSPLQAVVADAILRGPAAPDRGRTLVLVENPRFAAFFEGCSCEVISDTRLKGRRDIAANVRRLMGAVAGAVTLWVSDILWPMNNAAYTALLRSGRLNAVNFFDEGMVLYWQEQQTAINHVREWVKFRALHLALGVRFTSPARAPFYGNARNGPVYALHPELLSTSAPVRPLDLDLNRVAELSGLRGQGDSPGPLLPDGSALVLSQPYYRVADPDEFGQVIAGLAGHLRRQGQDRLYVKLHPSEGADLFERYYRPLGFTIAFEQMTAPVETVLQGLPPSCILASFNSSALLNARKFGFPGSSVSYGLDWIGANYPLRRNLFAQNAALMAHAGVAVVPHGRV